MRVIAPGKLVLTGAYAVLDGAPAIVVAVDRYAAAEIRSPAQVDVGALHDEAGRKLGLGSSAASAVATIAARAMARGEDPRYAAARAEIFRLARAAHAREQRGGSGVDVAASVHGGALRYVVRRGEAAMRSVELPPELVLTAFWSGTSARTSDLRARVDALRSRSGDNPVFSALREGAAEAADALEGGSARAFVARADAFGRALDALGHAADAPIVPPAFAELARIAQTEQGAFLPSGAGGGDVAIWLGVAPPSVAFTSRADALGLRPLALSVDRGGVRPESPS